MILIGKHSDIEVRGMRIELITTSPDLRGLVAEAKTADDLVRSVYGCTDMLLEAELHHQSPPTGSLER